MTDRDPTSEHGAGLLVWLLKRLPEQYVKALWLAEVEGEPAARISRRLGTAPDVTVILVHQAREGARQAYLREQPGVPRERACAAHWARLPAYVRGAASVRTQQALEVHLAACADCHGRMMTLLRAGRGIPVEAALLELAAGEDGSFLRELRGSGVGVGAGVGAGAGSGVVLGPLRFRRHAEPR